MSDFTLEAFTDLYLAAFDQPEPIPGLSAEKERYTAPAVIEKLWTVADRLIDNAKKFNLTSILDPAEIVRKHILDSLIPLGLLREAGYSFDSLLDMGTGAGFPLLPMACAMADEDVTFTGLDATAKKISHILETASACCLPSVSAVSGRAEERARGDLREAFGCVTARAVAELPVLCELCAPFVRVGGFFCAMKSHVDGELEPAKSAAKKLGLGNARRIDYLLPGGDARCLVIFPKISAAPLKFPRRYADIKKQPLK